ncbi:MAG: phosphatase PAP2 family protein [Candidatus Azambacteria bacterium]|nr:phosphatase PAP2 family protein [Candidatus Azambacteria bacterium]
MDLAISQFVFGLIGRWGWLDGGIIFLAKFLPYLMGLAFLFFLFQIKFWPRKIYFGLFAILAVIISRGFFIEIIRFFYDRPRPFEVLGLDSLLTVNDPAFPSAHAAFFFTLAFVLFLFNHRWGWAFAGLALVNGLARIFSGVHWSSDILGGLLVAFASVFITNRLLKKFSPDNHLVESKRSDS